MLPIEIIQNPSSTDFVINKKLGLKIIDLKSFIKIECYKQTLRYKKAGAHNTWYSIPYRMTEKQKNALLNQLYEATNLDLKQELQKIEKIQEHQNKRKALLNRIPETITGFKGNLLTNFIFLDGNSKHDKIRVYEAD